MSADAHFNSPKQTSEKSTASWKMIILDINLLVIPTNEMMSIWGLFSSGESAHV